MSIWSVISDWCNKPAVSSSTQWIDKANVTPTYDDVAIKADETYVRISIAEMMLTESRAWFKDLQPSVQALTRCKFGDQTMEVPSLAAPDPKQFPDHCVLRNFRLLDLIPFRGNSIEVTAALIAIPGDDKLSNGIQALANVASLFSAPIGSALVAADKLRDSIAMLAGSSASVHLAYHNTFTAETGANQLRCGYLAIVGAAPSELGGATPVVNNDGLRLRTSGGEVPIGRDYILLRFEILANRDDMENFSDIAKARQAAIAAAIDGPPEVADRACKAAVAAALLHPELTNADRRVLATRIKAELDELRPKPESVAVQAPAPGAGISRAPSAKAALPSWSELVRTLPKGTDQSPVDPEEFL